MKKGLLIILSGPSGVGKGTVRKILMQEYDLNLVYSISMTTRKPRNGEINGQDYFFVSKEQFDNAIKNNELLEYAQFVENYYGTPKVYVEKLRNEGKNVLLEIETQGAKQIMKQLHGSDEFSIFLVPPSLEELEKRIRGRNTEEEVVILERLEKAKKELLKKDVYNYIVMNDTPSNAAKGVAKIIKEHLE